MEELNGILHGLPILALIHLVAIMSVIIAIMTDLCFGWRKAKIRGEAHTSYAFSRTFTKFLLYMGIMIVTGCIDLLIHFVLYMFGYCYFVPVLAIAAAIGLCITEIWSMKEKADKKTRNNLKHAIEIMQNTITPEQAAALLSIALKKQNIPQTKK